ncbi:hypothetical protein [Crocosphaera chwakensis]|uniref:Uncharacterized protein n=1 Tax=Crocosphaera chwakensis CCY0110 TaxID=391612 RepID=A3IMT3_9CHRO|nr:hypothetical protein [Crocosphaera chwakensis]EAZ92186.1 hypothetical protein CY0110_24786 [Crocosphaera chwakensis CCY0110]
MKVLLDVIKTLLLINGAVVLPSFLLIMALYEQQSTNLAAADDVSSKFHRNIQDDTPKYQQKLEKLEAQKNQLQAKLEASQKAKTVTPVLAANSSSVEGNPTKMSPVSRYQTPVNLSKSSVNRSVETKIATPSQPKAPQQPSQKLVANNPSKPTSAKAKVTVIEEKKSFESVSEVDLMVYTSIIDKLFAVYQPSNKEVSQIAPDGFVSVADLNQTNQHQARLASYSIAAPQAKTPIDQPITLANDLSVGLIVADNRNELNYGTKNYKRVQTAILSLRKGNSQTLEEAAQKAGIDPDTLKWLARYGQNRPGSFNPPQISMINQE